MTVIAKRLRSEAHLACIQIVLDGVGVAHLIVFVLGIIVYLLEKAVGTHVFEVVHLHRAALGGLCFPTAARERQPVKHVKKKKGFPQQYSMATTKKRGAYASSTTAIATNDTTRGLANQRMPSTKLHELRIDSLNYAIK